MTQATQHGPHCPTPLKGACLKFSTDGTRMGADIAHVMGTTDEEEIKASGALSNRATTDFRLTGMPEEQADWEEGLDE